MEILLSLFPPIGFTCIALIWGPLSSLVLFSLAVISWRPVFLCRENKGGLDPGMRSYVLRGSGGRGNRAWGASYRVEKIIFKQNILSLLKFKITFQSAKSLSLGSCKN